MALIERKLIYQLEAPSEVKVKKGLHSFARPLPKYL
jgi:hypothetical protein